MGNTMNNKITIKTASVLLPLIASLFIALVMSTNVYASHQYRVLFNNDWQYLENNASKPELAQNLGAWTDVTLPHTWNATDTVDTIPGYRRSASWYRKTISTKELNNKVTRLYFEGANFETEVYLDDKLVGEHVGGYIGFTIDLSEHLKSNHEHILLVRVSNRYNPNLIPSQKADFFLYGGITRDVWLETLPERFIERSLISTPQVSSDVAKTQLNIKLSKSFSKRDTIKIDLLDPKGELVFTKSHKVNSQNLKVWLDPLKQPLLWSPESPHLYKARIQLVDKNKQIIHQSYETIGYRWFEMKPHQGFFLNGEPLLLRGTHRHEEHAGVGAAMSNAQHRADMQMIKDLGANFLRLGHYPQDPVIYQTADELGLILWDELPWCRGGMGGKEWQDNTLRIWQQQILQNYNHPSIVFWSLGNEMYWEEDFPGGGATELINPFVEKLNKLTKTLDPQRLTTMRKYYPGAHLVDSFSPSIWAGWYGGSYNQYQEALANAHKQYPAFLHMEYGGSSHVGRHTETPIPSTGLADIQVSVEEAVNQAVVKSVAKDSDWNENYIVDLFDWHLNVSENFEGFAGNAQWAFKDFGTPLRPENPLPFVNQKGLVDRAGNKKDAYYVFASYWKKDPICYIESKTWNERNGSENGRPVTVYCNTEQAELFLNGQSLGLKNKQKGVVPAGGLVWQTPFKNGVNRLKVVGFNQGQEVTTDSLEVTYLIGNHGKFSHIELSKKKLNENTYRITAEAVDKDGNRVLDYSERAYFFNIGDHGQLIENQGTPYGSSTVEMASGIANIDFIASDKQSIIEFRSQNIKGVYLIIDPQ